MSRTTNHHHHQYKRHGAALLDGLPLPDAPSAPTVTRPAAFWPAAFWSAAFWSAAFWSAPFRPGRLLWSIAARDLGSGAPDSAIEARWREIYAANLALVGRDPAWWSRGNDSASPPETGLPGMDAS